MKRRTIIAALIPIVIFAGFSAPSQADSQEILVDDVWARASIGMSRPGAVYLTIRNTGGKVVTLVGIETQIADRAEVHRTATDANGVSSMAYVGDLSIAPGREVELKPGGLHIMLMGLKEPMLEGSRIKLELIFDDGGRIPVAVSVRGIAATGPRS
ncbi:MAG: copper chaperone PCu(A)C [Rhodobacteraceae bacterium]|jgi:copper(I)-binding protein|uniref:copper chaperone PCu(A)C n=1 Tax=Salipiger TaxID=263377 RepID=UPI0009754BA6|nr:MULTISPECIES: copper chaperone PCu(A)C [Salipiger]MAB06736.1 copper chaperone PCu(A)C [Paracoccaceae bacterium]MAU43711.1 copper chaperone PCu(A)C [Salipiger sp.]MWD27527.1 copper chaperone PCu(A)C [Carideicomes alvinocaridis]